MNKITRLARTLALPVAAMVISSANAATLKVSRQTETSVTFAIGADGLDYELFVAHGATDGGEDKHAWDSFEKIADIAGDQTTYEYAVPAALRDGRPLRFFLMQTIGVNMAKELDYVRSTSQQWVDTGVAPNGRTMVDFRFGDPVYAASTAFFGRDWTGSRYLFNQQQDKFYFHGKSGVVIGAKPARGVDYRLVVDDDACTHLWANGVETTTYHKDLRNVAGSGNIAVFACNNNKNFATFSFYSMKICNNGSLQGDFIPALNAAGVPGLYNQANNTFHTSETATPLVAGNERPAARFGRVMDSTPSFHFRRSVAVAEATATTVTLSFGNPDGAAYKLYVAYGASDAEGDKNAWTSWDEVATIAADATTYEYTLPAALKSDGVFFRFFLVKTDNLPYASELASITSTGAQGVRVGYIPKTTTSLDFRFGSLSATNDKSIFGQSWYWGGNWLFCRQSNAFKFGINSTSAGTLDSELDSSADYRLLLTDAGKIYMSHNNVNTMYSVTRTGNSPCDLTVFSTYPISYGGATHYSQYKFYSMAVKEGCIAARDLVPVQTAAGKGALFDRASGLVFENATSTDFTKGAAVAHQGWAIATSEPSYAGSASGAPTPAGLVESITLTEDTEWSAIEGRLHDYGTVNLNGHELHVADYATFHPKHVTLSGTGNFRVTVPANETLTFTADKPVFTGKLIKDGAGTLVIGNSMSYLTGVTVAEGIMKYGATSVFGNNGMTVEVKDGAAFDVAGNGNGNAVRYKIAGIGPDGNGALRNTGGDVTNGSSQMYGLELTADAKVTGNSQGFIGPNYAATTLALNGHTLTLELNSGKSFWFCNTSGSTSGTVHVKSGVAYFYKTAVNIPNVDFVIDGSSSIYRIPTSTQANPVTVNSVTVMNGGVMEEGYQSTKPKHLKIFDGGYVGLQNHIKWIYVSGTVVVSNETTDVTLHPPIEGNSTYAKLLKYGAGTFYIKNNHTDQKMNSGAEIFGGTVVMDSTASTRKPEIAISVSAVPVTIHAGGTLDMRLCTNAAPFKVTRLWVDEGGTLLHAANNNLSIAGAATYEKPLPFGVFAGSLEIAAAVTFNLADFYASESAPTAGADVTLFSAATLTHTSAGTVVVTGCPYDCYVTYEDNSVVLHTASAAVAALDPIKIWNVGGTYVYGANGYCYRAQLGELLAAEGWNVQMTGWRTANTSAALNSHDTWKRHAGVVDLALKTSATRAGLLEGLETYCAAANEPDFTILLCGDKDVADGVADATIFAHYTNAVMRIKAALPMTTVIACTIPGGSAALNESITNWCATASDVEAVDVSELITTAQTESECAAVAAAIKAKLVTLATASGKNTPSTWVRPAVVLDATNNVPAAYLTGFTRVRTIEPAYNTHYAQNLYQIPYSYAPAMQESGIEKVGYYIELVRRDTGALQAMWIDMDAPGSNWADVALPVTHAQRKQQTVTKLHVWSNFGGVSQVAADDDTVDGYLEFNPVNYNGTDRTGDVISEPWTGNVYGFNDTLTTSGTDGHACFQIMRKFSETGAFPAAEVLFSYTRWGNNNTAARGLGMGTLADYGNHGYSTSKELDWTFTYGEEGSDIANLSSTAYSYIRIEFWLKYAEPSTRATMAKFLWTGATDANFATVGNWAKDETVATSLANANILLPEGATQAFTYVGYDPISLTTTTLMVDGSASFPEVGGFYLYGLDMGETGRITFDPVKFSLRLVEPPTFASGAKFALPAKYASATKGRFLLMTWDKAALVMDDAALNAVFDTTSAHGADVKVWAENFETGGGRLWLDLNYSAPKERINVLCTGDSITQGSDSTYGNWRVFLMKRLAAAGYAPVAKGHWKVESNDICGAVMPEEWVWHSGISGQRLVTKGGGGTIDAIDAMLDCAGDVDFVLAKICTNDINSNNATAEELFPVWTNLVWKTLNRKPHVKFIAGAVVDMADKAAKNEQVIAFNAAMSNAIASATFPAKRAYFADLYTPCYRYDGQGNFITGSFQNATDLHPDWPGEDKMAETYCNAILGAIADDSGFELGAAETVTETTSGIENNVPAAYLAGMTRARVFDIAANGGTALTSLGYVPYSYENSAAPTKNLSRVGYYIELKRKDTDLDDYHDLVRWIWVSIDAFGDRTLADNGIPLTTINQRVVNRLRVISNMPGIEPTSADENNVRGWVEFWPSQYNVDASGLPDAPANTFRCDWNDIRSNNMSGYGSMQVHRFTPGEANPAQVMFAFNRWTGTDCYEIGIGNFAHNGKAIDQTWFGDANTRERNTSLAYEVAKLEIWTASDTPDGAAFVLVDAVSPSGGGEVNVAGEVRDFGEGATNATLTLEWSTDPSFATVAGSTNIGVVAETGTVTATATGLTAGQTWYFRFTSVNSENVSAASGVSDPLDYSEGVWRPQTASDVWTSVAWQKNGTGEHVTLNPAWTAKFDGNESTTVASVQVPERVAAKQVTVDASANYTLTGAGAISSERLVKKGTGTVTLGAAVLAETPDIEIQGGTVKLGADATKGAAGMAAGTITVKDGGQFDLNYNDTTSGDNRARALVTRDQKFVIEGAGPDGEGAIVSTYANNVSGTPINNIEMTGDATIGGVGRIDLRTASTTLVGPMDATLTVKTHPSGEYGLGPHGKIEVGKIVISQEGKLFLESTGWTVNVPNGIDLYGALKFYNNSNASQWKSGAITALGSAPSIGNNANSAHWGGPLVIPSGVTLTMNGSKSLYYDGKITNNGTISVSSGTHLFEGGVEAGSGAKINVTGGSLYLSGMGDYGDGDYNVSLSGGGSLVIGRNSSGYGMPNFGKDKVTVTAASGYSGTMYFHPAVSSSIDGLACSGTINKFFMQGPGSTTKNGGPIIDGHANNIVFTANNYEIGNGNGRGEWTVTGENSHIAVKGLYANWIGSDYYAGSLTFKDGLLDIGSDGIKEAWTDPKRTAFNMESGTLRATANFNIGKAGMRATFGSPKKGGAVTFDLNGKTVKWGTGLTGASDVTLTGAGTFALDRPGIQGIPLGKWTVNATGTVDLRNAAGFAGGLALAENVTAKLDIAGTNMVEFLAWTWSGNAWDTMLPAFLGTTPVAITPFVATSLTYFNRKASALVDVKYGNGSGFNYLGEFYVSAEQAGTWTFSHNGVVHNGLAIDDTELDRGGKNSTTEKSISLTEGWHKFMLSIYCDAVNQTIGPRNSGTESYTFKAPGDTAYRPFDTTTVPMRMRQDVKARTSVRWRKYTNAASNLNIYDTVDESKYAAIDTVTNSLQVIHAKFSTGTSAPLGGSCNRFDGYFKVEPEQEGIWTFQGNFDDQIALTVDGRRLFTVRSNCATASGTMTLRAGWHKFDIRIGDNSTANNSGGTGGGLTDSVGNVCALEFKVNGGAYYAFDERYLPIAYTVGDAQKFEQPGLGGEIELAAGSILTNDVRIGGWCPIYGTLKGTGTLAGPYRFTGENNSWVVEGATARSSALPAVNFIGATPDTFRGLKSLSVTFDAKPTRRAYYLTGAVTDLTDDDIANVALSVVDEEGDDYTESLTLTVKDGRLALTNAKPAGMYLIVR